MAGSLSRMVAAQRHRGPDGEGQWLGRVGEFNVLLGHLRLAILDLTDAGRQPMYLPDGSHGIVYNGEVYNYRELRTELEALGVCFMTNCDTEIVLWALATWGEDAISKFNGMWAFAWIDTRRAQLVLSRDRFGVKPLYVYKNRDALFFASEIKSILVGSGEKFAVNARVAGRYIEQSLLGAQNETFFEGIESVPAGHNARFDLSKFAPLSIRPRSYWTPITIAERDTEEHYKEEIRNTFLDAVKVRLRSDVPVGVLLSGGVDSSAIAAAMQNALGIDADVHAISAVSGNNKFDEAPFIRMMAGYLNCPAHEVKLDRSPEQWFSLLDEVVYFNDEPIGSFSTVAHYLLMQEAKRQGVTVILSGQGADELLCGYLKYTGFYLQELARSGRLLAAGKLIAGFARNRNMLGQFEWSEARRYLGKLAKLGEVDICGPRLRDRHYTVAMGLGNGAMIDRQLGDLTTYSVPALVHYEDRCSMAMGREVRLPFLDYRLVNLLLPLDPEWKLRHGWTKWIFREAIKDLLPGAIVWRKGKQGFINPQSEWLKHELRPAVEEFISSGLLTEKLGLVNSKALARVYRRYSSQPSKGGVLSFKDIFNPLVLEIWARRFERHLRV
jgi:asparagine synthase (glutamine-hydrolysing)